MAWATSDDVIDDWIGNDVPTNTLAIDRWIARAERLLRREFPDLQARIEAETEPDLLDTVKDVVSAMVTRVFRNPEGIRQRQETDGAFTGSITFGGDQPGALVLLESERDSLKPPGSGKTGQAFSIGVNSGSCVRHIAWCTVKMGGENCSCGATIAGRPIYEGGESVA